MEKIEEYTQGARQSGFEEMDQRATEVKDRPPRAGRAGGRHMLHETRREKRRGCSPSVPSLFYERHWGMERDAPEGRRKQHRRE